MKDIKFDFDDILIKPEITTKINSRYSDIDLPQILPIYTAPMDTVIDLTNLREFIDENIMICLPRTVSYEQYKMHVFDNILENEYIGKLDNRVFLSFGINDIEKILLADDDNPVAGLFVNQKILIDVANGHMEKIVDLCKRIKAQRPDVIIMVGNIANPETYEWYARHECVDYIRVGIGNGCFIAGSKVTTKNGLRNIEDVIDGEEVLTHSGEYKVVASTRKREHCEDLIKINNVVSTPNHEYYVLNKKYQNIVTDDNVGDLCEWVSAKELSENDGYLLIEINTHYGNEVEF